jgi:hypothetical protein
VLLHLEFYPLNPAGSHRGCERIAFGTTSVNRAIVHARDLLENRMFSFGHAKFCLIKDDQGKVLRQMKARRLGPSKIGR